MKFRKIDLYGHDEMPTITHKAAEYGIAMTLEKLLEVRVDVDGPGAFGQVLCCERMLKYQANKHAKAYQDEHRLWKLTNPSRTSIPKD